MSSVVFIVSGDASDAERLARPLRDRGWLVETETRDPAAACSRVGECNPRAVVISLSFDPDAGCDLACALSVASVTSNVPVLFVGGTPADIDAARAVRPDGEFLSPEQMPWAIKRFDG